MLADYKHRYVAKFQKRDEEEMYDISTIKTHLRIIAHAPFNFLIYM